MLKNNSKLIFRQRLQFLPLVLQLANEQPIHGLDIPNCKIVFDHLQQIPNDLKKMLY